MLQHKEKYQGKQGKKVVAELTEHSYGEIAKLLREGSFEGGKGESGKKNIIYVFK